MIVEKARDVGAPLVPDAQQAAGLVVHALEDEARCGLGVREHGLVVEQAARPGEPGDRQRVPRGDALAIGARAGTLGARVQQGGALGGEALARLAGEIAKDALAALEVAALGHVVGAGERGGGPEPRTFSTRTGVQT